MCHRGGFPSCKYPIFKLMFSLNVARGHEVIFKKNVQMSAAYLRPTCEKRSTGTVVDTLTLPNRPKLQVQNRNPYDL